MQLVGELTIKSAEFRQWWKDLAVRDRTSGVKRLNHPVVGRLDIAWSAFPLPQVADETLFIYTARTPRDADALRLLASWAAGTRSAADKSTRTDGDGDFCRSDGSSHPSPIPPAKADPSGIDA